jgi:hypothetical protein
VNVSASSNTFYGFNFSSSEVFTTRLLGVGNTLGLVNGSGLYSGIASPGNRSAYVNYDSGTGGVQIGNGNRAIVSTITADGSILTTNRLGFGVSDGSALVLSNGFAYVNATNIQAFNATGQLMLSSDILESTRETRVGSPFAPFVTSRPWINSAQGAPTNAAPVGSFVINVNATSLTNMFYANTNGLATGWVPLKIYP